MVYYRNIGNHPVTFGKTTIEPNSVGCLSKPVMHKDLVVTSKPKRTRGRRSVKKEDTAVNQIDVNDELDCIQPIKSIQCESDQSKSSDTKESKVDCVNIEVKPSISSVDDN